MRTVALIFALCLCVPAIAAPPAKRKAAAGKFVPTVGSGIIVSLQNGSKVEGIYRGEGDGAIWLEIDGGEAGLEKSTIVSLAPAKGGTPEFKRRAATLEPADAEGWWKLAQWAEQNELHSSAQSAARSAIKASPEHAAARKFLGHEKVGGQWYQGDDIHRAKGLVKYGDEWVAPENLEAAKQRAENEEKEKNLRAMRLHKPVTYRNEEPAPQKSNRPFGGWVER